MPFVQSLSHFCRGPLRRSPFSVCTIFCFDSLTASCVHVHQHSLHPRHSSPVCLSKHTVLLLPVLCSLRFLLFSYAHAYPASSTSCSSSCFTHSLVQLLVSVSLVFHCYAQEAFITHADMTVFVGIASSHFSRSF